MDLEIDILFLNDNWCFYCGHFRLHLRGSN